MPNKPAAKNDPLRGKVSGKWTKYGGAIYGLRKEFIQGSWFCQTCGDETPAELPPYNFEYYPGEFIRICNICKAKVDIIKDSEKTIVVRRIIKISRTKRD